jgi:hypothetical protein
MATTPATPILVLGTGNRCGSTLIQRLLSSHPDVLIWGEHGGQLSQLLAAGAGIHDWSNRLGSRARAMYADGGYQSFMANLVPENKHIDEALRAFLLALFAEPAAALGRPIWGLKEIRYGLAEATDLSRLFPDLRVVFVARNPRDILRSLDDWERDAGWWDRAGTEGAIRLWARVAESFLDSDRPDAPPVLRLRYEDVVRDPAGTADAIAAHTGLDATLFDMEVFDRRIVSGQPRDGRVLRDWAELPASMRQLLDSDDMRRLAAAYGYEV